MLGEGFQLDSSLSYHSGDNEGIEGDLDVVIPLWDGGRHVIFTQPGFVFWTGHEDEERIDGNIGLVYRAEIARDLIAGASAFYDHDFQIGHSRVGGGIDLQSGFFRFGANYYHVLSEIEDGREGFVEEAVDGMDARLVFEREVVRLGGTVGYWDYEGEESSGGENSQSGWQTSIGMDFGFRVLPGVFIEGSWERHKDDLVLDERIFAGLAFRFSLPDFEGGSYAGGEMSSNLYKIVDREKRILYEERLGIPRVNLPDAVYENDRDERANAATEGTTVTIPADLDKPLDADVMLNIMVDETSTATLGTDFTYGHRVYELDAATGEQTAPTGDATACPEDAAMACSVTIPAGVTRFDIEASISMTMEREVREFIDFRIEVPQEYADLLRGGVVERVVIEAHGNEIGFASDAPATLMEDDETTGIEVSVNINEPSPTPITLNVATSGTATEGTDYRISTTSLVIPANASSASLTLTGINNDRGEGSKQIVLKLEGNLPGGNLPAGWNFSPATDPDNPPKTITHTVTLQDDDLSIYFVTSGEGATPSEVEEPASDQSVTVTVGITQAPTAPIKVLVRAGETAETATEGTDYAFADEEFTFTPTGELTMTQTIRFAADNDAEPDETIVLTLSEVGGTLASEGSGFSLGANHTITILANDNTVGFASDAADTLDESGGTADVEVSLSNPAPANITLNVSVDTTSTATETTDFTLSPATLTISQGRTSGTITLTGMEDEVVEGDETIVLMLSAGSVPAGWGEIGTATHTVTIQDDPLPNISFSSADPGGVDENRGPGQSGYSLDVDINITPAPTSAINIPLTFTGNHAAYGITVKEGGTLTGTPSAGDVVIAVTANTSKVVLTYNSARDMDNDVDDIIISFGTLPEGYIEGVNPTTMFRVHE